MEFEELKTVQTLQKMDSTIHWINLYPVDGAIGFPYSYPLDSDLSSRIALSFPPRPWLFKIMLDSTIQHLNNQGLGGKLVHKN